MTSLSGNGAEPKSGSSSNGLIAGRDDLNLGQYNFLSFGLWQLLKIRLVDHPGHQMEKSPSRIFKAFSMKFKRERERERLTQESLLRAVLHAVHCLPVHEAQRIVIEVLKKDLQVREWFGRYWGPEMMRSGNENELDLTKCINWIKESHLSSLQKLIRSLIIDNGFIEKSLKKKLVEQKDGSFTSRDFSQESFNTL
ncbi:hypothetical protein EAE99_001398 [Botrytis elliptica]|nr:hypothetical protein EAE99_008621 [Botrytis elliptica]KAF7939593.1 hypothetical protein EAE99_001398 [Botrytis elliptica]